MHSIIFILCDAAPAKDHAVNPVADLTDEGIFDAMSITYNRSIDYVHLRDDDGKKDAIGWAKRINLLKEEPNGKFSLVKPVKWFRERIDIFRKDAEDLAKITDDEFVEDINVRILLERMAAYYHDRLAYVVIHYPYDRKGKRYDWPLIYDADEFVRDKRNHGKKYIFAAAADYHY